MSYVEWKAEVRRLLGEERFKELSTTLLGLLWEQGDTPDAAAAWCRIALGGGRDE